MSNYLIDGTDFHELEIQKYWQPPSTWSNEKRKTEVTNRIYSGLWAASRKMDGAFFQFNKSLNGEMELIGRSRSVNGDYLNKIEWMPQCQSFFDAIPNGTSLIGELVFPDSEGSKNTTTIIGCLKDKAITRQMNGPKLHYYVFDVLAWNGESMLKATARERFASLSNISEEFGNEEYVDFAVYYTGSDIWNQLQDILANGGEGMVMTRLDSQYQPGKRPSKDCMKVKKEMTETIDAVIIGAIAGTKLYSGKLLPEWKFWWDETSNTTLPLGVHYNEYQAGAAITPVTKSYYYKWAGSFKLGLYRDGEMIHFGDVSGLTDEMKENWRQYVGRVVRIGGMEIFRDGDERAIRHPKMLEVRPVGDKDPKECTWDQLA